ncbi:DUF2786 domain-containing protein [Mycena chlorophos]|uniref:DUF2786 domain-containing protein n=1 Tax=Mycena chlorophos TaxID=658473 RepID=A0A8H6TIF0_MYCCL|nr:DUF2786 domain-containing protein [Mycena chlorophos]
MAGMSRSVTLVDLMLGKRPRPTYKEDSDSESDAERHESEDEYLPDSEKRKIRTPTTKAEIVVRATDTPEDKADAQRRIDSLDHAVVGKICKALALAAHSGTNEAEARQALKMANTLLERHNVTQADMLAHETDAEKFKRAGQSTVWIRHVEVPLDLNERPNKIKMETWTRILAMAMGTFFDCQHFSEACDSYDDDEELEYARIEWTFYGHFLLRLEAERSPLMQGEGLAEQTVTAALAFEMCYNLIVVWALKPEVGTGVHHRNSYCTGIADGLYKMAATEKERDMERAAKREAELVKAREEEEAEEERRRLERLQGPPATLDLDGFEVTLFKKASVEEVPDMDATKPTTADDPKSQDKDKNKDDDENEAQPAQYQTTTRADFKTSEKVDMDLDKELQKSEQRAREKAAKSPRKSKKAKLDPITPSASPSKAKTVSAPAPAVSPTISKTAIPPPPATTSAPAASAPSPSKLDSPAPAVLKEEESESPWQSVMQLVKFREASKAIAEEYIKQQGIKLYTTRKMPMLKFADKRARECYELGEEDARKIDIRGRRIKDVEMD